MVAILIKSGGSKSNEWFFFFLKEKQLHFPEYVIDCKRKVLPCYKWLIPAQVYKDLLRQNTISIQQHHNQDEQLDFGGKEHTFPSERLKRKELCQFSLVAKLYMPQNIFSLKKSKMKSPKRYQSTRPVCLWGSEAIVWEKAIRWLYFAWNQKLIGTTFHFRTHVGGLKQPGPNDVYCALAEENIESTYLFWLCCRW